MNCDWSSCNWIDAAVGWTEKTSRSDSKVDFKWTVALVTIKHSESECYSSGIEAFNSIWSLCLYPISSRRSDREWFDLDIYRTGSQREDKIHIHFTLTIKLDGVAERSVINDLIFPTNSSRFVINKLLRWSDMQKRDPHQSRRGNVTIICTLWIDALPIGKEIASTSRESRAAEVPDAQVKEEGAGKLDATVDPSLPKHLKDMLLSGDDHDLTINVRNLEFRAHRGMLRARSPVFAAMFKHDTKERAAGSISIDDCDPDAFGEFLHYVYTGRVEELSPGKAVGLYYAADKYDFPGLKEVCVQFLEASLSKTSICDVVSLATRHGESGLLEKAVRFFSENGKEVLMTVEWQRFAEKNFVAANELCIKAFDALGKKEMNI